MLKHICVHGLLFEEKVLVFFHESGVSKDKDPEPGYTVTYLQVGGQL